MIGKKPWRHSSLPDEENSNYSGKSIFNPTPPLSTARLLGGKEGDREIYILDSINGSLFATCSEERLLVFFLTKHTAKDIQSRSVYETLIFFFFPA